MKVCKKCKVEKELTEFFKDKSKKDGFRSNCKSCVKVYKEANKDKLNAYARDYNKAYREANKEEVKAKQKVYYEANKDKLNANNKAYIEANKDKVKAKQKAYREANKDKRNAYARDYARERRKTDPLFKMKHNLRCRTCLAFKDKGYSKTSKTQEILGADWEVVEAHIEKQFTKGMSWDNQGDWHIDHIMPLASANTIEETIRLCHYTNLQPLWALDNLEKGAKII